MPGRRYSGRRFGGRGKRASTFWVDLAVEDTTTDSTANNNRNLVLFAPSDQDENITLLRTVGSVAMGLQAAAVTVTALRWGIFVAAQGSTDVLLLPNSATDAGSEDWLHWTQRYSATKDTEAVYEVDQWKVDIRVKRKLNDSRNLLWIGISSAAWSSAVNLRGLFQRTA